ncbi:MAG TPA: AMP-binding protein, partial [Vicinamibacterales bacterium]
MTTHSRPWLHHYDYWVPPHLNYPDRPLHEILDTTVVDAPDRPATSFFGATLTFEDIKDRSDRLATALDQYGIVKGDRIGIMLPNCPQYVIAAFAILRLGAVVVNINPSYTAREVLNVAVDSGIRMLIALDALA